MFNITLGLINFIQCSYFARINYITVLAHIKKIMKMLDPSIFAYIGLKNNKNSSVVKKFVPTKEKRKIAESVKNSLNI